jgi:hypothetical protein
MTKEKFNMVTKEVANTNPINSVQIVIKLEDGSDDSDCSSGGGRGGMK